MSSSKKIFSGIVWSSLGNIISALYGFFSVPILLFHFGKQQYGLIGLALSVNVYLKLMDMGFSSGNVKFFSQFLVKNDFVKLNKLFQSSLVFYGVVGIINGIILAIISYFAKSIFSLSDADANILQHMFYVLIISAFFGWISSLLDQFLRANEIIGWEQRLMIFSRLLQVLILFLTIKYNFNVKLFFMLTTFSSLIIIPFSVLKINSLGYKISYLPRYYNDVFKQILPYCLSIFSFGIFQFSAVYLRPIILSLRAGVAFVADYRILEGFASVILLLGSSFTAVILPSASKAKALGDTDKINKIAYDGTKYITIFLSFFVFGFILISSDLLTLYVGKGYSYLLIWLVIWILTLLAAHTSALSSLVLSEAKLRPIVIMSAFSSILSLGIAWFLTPIYKVGGVVFGYLFYNIFQMLFYYTYYYSKVMKLNSSRIFLKSFLFPSSFIAAVTVLLFYTLPMLNHVSKAYLRIGISCLVYGVVLIPSVIFLLLNKNDRDFVIGVLKFKKRNSINSL
ncbi:lipopolysaccharide biosynthesis protein [Mucilaginibacter flavus]|uniref:lipopolysaccharide biosynthesis protein n=1 Tax=Mucilaginibacter flavus TaxID=931504 RepID=UPI0025B2D7FF|nr:hypothetical protein [Mucilaginibacter flavus]MDN3583737.1 hypothetical protein [Mucilaginibacter flavus]